MSATRRKFTREFKLSAVERLIAGYPISQGPRGGGKPPPIAPWFS
jgi:hypothetical protein